MSLKRWKQLKRLAASKNQGKLKSAQGEVTFEVETLEAEGQPAKLTMKSFDMVAYTGGPMRPSNWWSSDPLIVDIEGMELPASQRIPVDTEHSTIVGHTTALTKMVQKIKAKGVFSGFSETDETPMAIAAREVIRLAKNEFPWQASMEFDVGNLQRIDAGETVKVNGRVFDGPVTVARKSKLYRVSFVANGADSNTDTAVAATANKGNQKMNFAEWLKANGFPEEKDLNEGQAKILRASWKQAQEPPTDPPSDPPAPSPDPTPNPSLDLNLVTREAIDQIRAQARQEIQTETNRVNRIQTICGRYNNPTIEANGQQVPLLTHAIDNNWDIERVQTQAELISLRSSRPQPSQGWFGYAVSGRPEPTEEILEASFAQTRGFNLNDHYSEQVCEAANKHYKGMSLQQLFLMCASRNGYPGVPGERVRRSNCTEVVNYAIGKGPRVAASGFTPLSLPGILGAVANKEIRRGYEQEPQQWRMIAKVEPIQNFYTHTSYRLLDNMEYEELAPGGEIRHGQIAEESYTRTARTYAKMFLLKRESIINDDLSAFDQLQRNIGWGAAQKLNKIFWTAFLDNSTFFTSARGNYIDGATSNLGINGVGLELGLKAWADMKTPAVAPNSTGRLVGGEPKFLLVPSILNFNAKRLFMSDKVKGDTDGVDANIHAGMYEVVPVSQLGDSSYSNYSATAWYLLRDPNFMPTMVVSFLDGEEMPTVESAEAEFNTLGLQWRGYHDFGCDKAEYLGGLKSKGAA